MNANSKVNRSLRNLELAFDVGHSSIGWNVGSAGETPTDLRIIGSGVVIFPPGDCLASERRRKRSMRRHFRATRKRVELLARYLVLIGAFTPEQKCAKLKPESGESAGHPAPWLLAARILAARDDVERKKHLLAWPELFDVLRWYAHNRGNNGNKPWTLGASDEAEEELIESLAAAETKDSEVEDEEKETARKVREGIQWMGRAPATETMAESVCKKVFFELWQSDGLKTTEQFHEFLLTSPQLHQSHLHTDYKGEKAPAYPRNVVLWEVRRILEYHRDLKHLKGCDDTFITALLKDWTVISDEFKGGPRDKTKEKIWLPKRYGIELAGKGRCFGGILFGQLIPRFENRIVSTCPVTYAKVLREQLNGGTSFPVAEHKARFAAKVPAKKSVEFLRFRWVANFLANIKVASDKNSASRSLSATARRAIDAEMTAQGFLSKDRLKQLVEQHSGQPWNNVDDMFHITSEAEEALTVDPARRFLRTNRLAASLAPVLQPVHRRLLGQLRRGKSIKLRVIRSWLEKASQAAFDAALQQHCEAAKIDAMRQAKAKGRRTKMKKPPTPEEVLNTRFSAGLPTGRARYHRNVLKDAVAEVLDGFDPRKKARTAAMTRDDRERAEDKPKDGVLVETDDMLRLRLGLQLAGASEEQAYDAWKTAWLKRRNAKKQLRNSELYETHGEAFARQVYAESRSQSWLAQQTNNHLVRHRLLILQRLTNDIVKTYADGDSTRIRRVAIEVARDLLAFSGMDSKAKKGAWESMSGQHERVRAKLDRELGEVNRAYLINGNLLWKAKIADDLGWRCPYTGEIIDCVRLAIGDFDIDHIIPKSVRLTNAMEAVVITFKDVNRLKGSRTAWEFIHDEERKTFPEIGKPIRTIKEYETFVEALRPTRSKAVADAENTNEEIVVDPKYLPGTQKLHPDYKRRKLRKKFLLLRHYDKEKGGFTSRDLTVTSHLNRLAQFALRKELQHLNAEDFVSIPGVVTSAWRDARGWQLLGCLRDERVCGAEVTREVIAYDRATKKPEIDPVTEKPKTKTVLKPKGELREITHLHHAVDAATLGVLAALLPKNGRLWELIALGELTTKEKEDYESLRAQFAAGRLENGTSVRRTELNRVLSLSKIENADEKRYPDPERMWRLVPRTDGTAWEFLKQLKSDLTAALREKRVVQHVPADSSGMAAEETYYRLISNFDADDKATRMVRRRIKMERDRLSAAQSKLDAALSEIERLGKKQKAECAEVTQRRKMLVGQREKASDRVKAIGANVEKMADVKNYAWVLNWIPRESQKGKDLLKAVEKFSKWQAAQGETVLYLTPTKTGKVNKESDENTTEGAAKKPPKDPQVLSDLAAPGLDYICVFDVLPREKMIGLTPEGHMDNAKLPRLKAAKIISDNYAIAIVPNNSTTNADANDRNTLHVVRWRKVRSELGRLRALCDGKPIDLLKTGSLVRIGKQPAGSDKDYTGVWRVTSIKDNEVGVQIDMLRPHFVKAENKKLYAGMNKSLETFLHCDLEVFDGKKKPPLTGVACPTTSSASTVRSAP